MDFDDEEEEIEDIFLDDCPGILISCISLEDLQELIYTLYEKDILHDESAFLLKNVPENINDILNYPEYFEETEVFGIHMLKGQLRGLEVPTEDLL